MSAVAHGFFSNSYHNTFPSGFSGQHYADHGLYLSRLNPECNSPEH
jgi:hypothetical protein